VTLGGLEDLLPLLLVGNGVGLAGHVILEHGDDKLLLLGVVLGVVVLLVVGLLVVLVLVAGLEHGIVDVLPLVDTVPLLDAPGDQEFGLGVLEVGSVVDERRGLLGLVSVLLVPVA